MSFGLYLLGFAMLIFALAYAGVQANIPGHWIAVGAVALIGIAIMSGVSRTRMKDPN